MTARALEGNSVAESIYVEISAKVRQRQEQGRPAPHLAAVLVGADPASETYIRMKRRNCERVGFTSSDHRLPDTASTAEVVELVRGLNADDGVSGILVQMPLPPQVDPTAVVEAIDPIKDVDGLHPYNAGRLALGATVVAPCTPAGIMELLSRYEVTVSGRRAVVVGRSILVGRPVALLLLAANATVTICHSHTADLPAICAGADILIAAIGKPLHIQPAWVKPGAAVIDVGVTRQDGQIVGDVDPGVAAVAGWLTPNPGGVGPMTRASLVRNTYEAEVRRRP